ncbi:hypothetical protein C0995_015917 [Termitomyces sp. Mi166|nr:hypothetical protein C0995_015917 [Termitomyces sp. Mi166\
MSTSVLLEAPQFKSTQTPLKSAHLSSQSYVLSIVSLPGHYAASASAPANTIDIFDKTTLQGVETLSGHDDATTSLHSVENITGLFGRSLISSGRDGSVKIWDLRSNSHSIKMTNLGASRALLCCDVSPDGLTVVAGTEMQGDDAFILYWDPRRPAAPLRTHGSTHSDDITVVSFAHAELGMPRNTLLSASSDGLVSTSNADEADEDEAVLHVGNWGCSVSQAGWIQASSDAKIWAASDMETFSTWTHELDLCQSLDIRSPVLHAVPDAPWYLHNTWSVGHVGVVRSLLWDHESNVLVTGGEDTKIHVWPSLSSESRSDEDAMDVDSNPRKRSLNRDDEQEGKRAKR